MKKSLHIRKDIDIFSISLWGIVFLWCVLFLGLMYWMILTSFKDSFELIYNQFGLPELWMPENYTLSFKNIKVTYGTRVFYFGELLQNTLILCIGVPLVSHFVICITTYIAARFRHIPWTRCLFIIYIITSYMPAIGGVATSAAYMMRLGLYDNWLGVFLREAGGFGGSFLIYYGAWKSFSYAYSEAAQLDGANQFQIFLRIMVPMIAPVFFVMALGTVQTLWEQGYGINLTILPSYPNLSFAAYNIINGSYDDVNILQLPNQIAFYVLFSVPMFILYFATKNWMIKASGFAGGLKG